MILQVKEIANENVKIAPQRKTMNSKIAPGKKKIISSLDSGGLATLQV